MNITSMLINWVKNKVKVSRIFWQYRHLLQRHVWRSYLGDYKSQRRLFYSDFVKKHCINSIFEFGCGPGPNLLSLKKNVDTKILVYGVEINSKAVSLANKYLPEPKMVTKQFKNEQIKAFLAGHSLAKFDLAIYDRVLYLLSPQEVVKHFTEISGYVNYVIIDDFASKELQSYGSYHSKDYEMILNKVGFDLIQDSPSEHCVSNEFFASVARRQIYKNR